MVISTVAHVAVGALILATAVVLAIQVWRHVPVAFEERVASGGGRPVAAGGILNCRFQEIECSPIPCIFRESSQP